MDFKYMYAFRGLIAFVAFTDLGAAVKAFVEKKCILNEFSDSDTSPLPRIYGIYAILQTIILIHCTLFIHSKPLVSLGICCLTLSTVTYLLETLVFRTVLFDFHIMFPCILNVITALGLIATIMWSSDKSEEDDDENLHLFQKAKMFKRNIWNEKLQ